MPRVALYPVAHRLICRRCLKAGWRDAGFSGSRREMIGEPYLAWFRTREIVLVALGLGARAGLFALVFAWAAKSEVGAGALSGVVAAEVFGWCVSAVLDWPMHGLRLTAGVVFEGGLLALYSWREDLFAIPEAAEAAGVAFPFFLAYACVRLAFWGCERLFETHGLT